ncbi:MAG: hypothetical protein ABSB60_08905 [Terracidiphilus sp.]|jgi:hypothetical protein
MINYAKLADIAKSKDVVDTTTLEAHKKLRPGSCGFYENVLTHLVVEMKKANVELKKRNAPLFDQIKVPSFDDEFLLTYGINSMCRVGRGIMSGGCRITAVISGPPNGYEISRREYLCKKEETCREVISIDELHEKAISFAAEEVAEDIISGVLIGKFI